MFQNLIKIILCFSLTGSHLTYSQADSSTSTLAPETQMEQFTTLKQHFLNNKKLSSNLLEQKLARFLLRRNSLLKIKWDKKLIAPILVSFSAAFFAALSVMGQETVLNKVHFLHYLFMQPFLVSIIFVTWLKFKLKQNPNLKTTTFKSLQSFFPNLKKNKAVLPFISGFIAYQVIRNGIFFFVLPQISSTGAQMIAVSQLIFTPFIELLWLKVNKFKPNINLAFVIIAVGLVGYNWGTLSSLLLVSVAMLGFLGASFESIARKVVVQKTGSTAKNDQFTLTLLAWNYFLSFSVWFGSWLLMTWTGLIDQFSFLKEASVSHFIGNLSSYVIIFLTFTVGNIVLARYFDQKARTYKDLAVSIFEAIRQSKIIFTAVIVTTLVLLAGPIGFALPLGFAIPSLTQWFFIGILLGGVLWLSNIQYHEEKDAQDIYIFPNKKLTLTDWNSILKIMTENSHKFKEDSELISWSIDEYFRSSNPPIQQDEQSPTPETLPQDLTIAA